MKIWQVILFAVMALSVGTAIAFVATRKTGANGGESKGNEQEKQLLNEGDALLDQMNQQPPPTAVCRPEDILQPGLNSAKNNDLHLLLARRLIKAYPIYKQWFDMALAIKGGGKVPANWPAPTNQTLANSNRTDQEKLTIAMCAKISERFSDFDNKIYDIWTNRAMQKVFSRDLICHTEVLTLLQAV